MNHAQKIHHVLFDGHASVQINTLPQAERMLEIILDTNNPKGTVIVCKDTYPEYGLYQHSKVCTKTIGKIPEVKYFSESELITFFRQELDAFI